jgi:hypothetical protein
MRRKANMKLCYFILIILVPSSLFALDNTPKLSNDIMMITMSKGPKFVSSDNQPVNHEPEVLVMESEKEPDTSNEVVGGNQPATLAMDGSIIRTSPRPEERPSDLNTKPVATETKASAPGLYDMRGCTYGRGSATNSKCYKSMSTIDRAKRIMGAVNYVNQLHKTKFDGRYMLCTGYRESNFNPGAKGADGERGMFQVMTATGKAALRYGVELSEFKNMSGETYMTKMANSTVAQVELSFLVLKMKLAEDAANSGVGQTRQKRIMSGEGSVDHYRSLAGRYNGGGYNSVYAKRISSCYSCLRGKMAANATSFGTEIQTCLNKAK